MAKNRHAMMKQGMIQMTNYLSAVLELIRQPVQTLVQSISRSGAGGLNVPASVSECVQTELVSDFRCVHGVGQILLVGEDEKDGVTQLVLGEHTHQLLARLTHTLAIVRVDHEDQTLSVLEVVPPERADLVLSSDVPHGERDVLVLDGLDVEADGGDSSDDLAELELVQDGRLTGGVQSDHQNAHLLLAEEAFEQVSEDVSDRKSVV